MHCPLPASVWRACGSTALSLSGQRNSRKDRRRQQSSGKGWNTSWAAGIGRPGDETSRKSGIQPRRSAEPPWSSRSVTSSLFDSPIETVSLLAKVSPRNSTPSLMMCKRNRAVLKKTTVDFSQPNALTICYNWERSEDGAIFFGPPFFKYSNH